MLFRAFAAMTPIGLWPLNQAQPNGGGPRSKTGFRIANALGASRSGLGFTYIHARKLAPIKALKSLSLPGVASMELEFWPHNLIDVTDQDQD